jgi:hypothetical protein
MRYAAPEPAFRSIENSANTSQFVLTSRRVAGVVMLGMSLLLSACHGSSDDEVPVVIIGDGNSGHVRYLDTYTYDAHRVFFYQDVPGKYEPETVSVWVFPNESSLLVSEHQLDGYSNRISIYTRVVVFDEYATESEMMAWLDDDLAGYHYPVQPESVTWIDNAVSVDSLIYQDTILYGNEFVDEYEVQYHVDGVSVPGEFVLYSFDDYERVLALYDL